MFFLPELNFGNLRTIESFLKNLNLNYCNISYKDLNKIESGILIIPGNGNWSSYIKSGIVDLIKNKKELIFIGICGGFQIFFQNSEEGDGEGAAVMSGNVIKLSSVIPTIGYINVGIHGPMYFSNSYGVPFDEFKDAKVEFYQYGGQKFLGCFKFENYIGFQFHPEVSGKPGRDIFLKYIKHLNMI